jgi:hypothetical protein
MTTQTCLLIGLLTVAPLAHAKSGSAAPAARYYFVIRGVDESPGVSSKIADKALDLLKAELASRPGVTLAPAPAGKTTYEVTLKITNVVRDLKAPEPGKQFRTLERGIALSIFGSTLPERKLAIGGDGRATVAAELGKNEDPEKEGTSLLLDATKVAITQAVDMTITKLNLSDKGTIHVKKKK